MYKVEKTLKLVLYCTLATVCEDGSPWGTPVFFVADEDMNIYWWSDEQAQHSRNIAKNPKVFITVFDSSLPESQAKGVYISALAEAVSRDDLPRIIDLYNSKAKDFELTTKNTTGNAPTRLYKAKLAKKWTNSSGRREGMYIDVREELV